MKKHISCKWACSQSNTVSSCETRPPPRPINSRYIRVASLKGDVKSEITVDERERGCVGPSK